MPKQKRVMLISIIGAAVVGLIIGAIAVFNSKWFFELQFMQKLYGDYADRFVYCENTAYFPSIDQSEGIVRIDQEKFTYFDSVEDAQAANDSGITANTKVEKIFRVDKDYMWDNASWFNPLLRSSDSPIKAQVGEIDKMDCVIADFYNKVSIMMLNGKYYLYNGFFVSELTPQ